MDSITPLFYCCLVQTYRIHSFPYTVACWEVFTEPLPDNALIKSVIICSKINNPLQTLNPVFLMLIQEKDECGTKRNMVIIL
jgi:hypothetical protein